MEALTAALRPRTSLLLATSIALLFNPPSAPAEERSATGADEVVITAPRAERPLTIVTDPRRPRQPVPAHDGADYLKNVPGFSVVRKGGTDADPVLRGMAASRLGISLDGAQVLGGCSARMDPPTAYVFPESFDRIVVTKGPQSVLHGPGLSAGSVSFERQSPSFDHGELSARGSVLAGSFARRDVVAEVVAGGERGFLRLQGTRAESGDYRDGDGRDVHGRYLRWGGDATLGWTPDAQTLVELSLARSDGEAAYADRLMDGVKFDREAASLRLRRKDLSGLVRGYELLAYSQYVDHAMDNFSLRSFTPSMMMPGRSVSNPDRRTQGLRGSVDVTLGAWHPGLSATAGLEWQHNLHRARSTMNEGMVPYASLPRIDDGEFSQVGLFAEAKLPASPRLTYIAGARLDHWEARDPRATVPLGMMGSMPNPTAGQSRSRMLPAAFLRAERELASRPVTLYAGVGHVERFPDYWEMFAKETTSSASAFHVAPERTTQLDAGALYRGERWDWSVSAFAGRVDDYLLVESGYRKGMRTTTVVRNVSARTWGGEVDARWRPAAGWVLTGTLAHVQGTNATDDVPLAQQPPLEARLAVERAAGAWRWGALVRAVAPQTRVAFNQGTVVGQDLGPTPGFAVVSLNAAWQSRRGMRISGGIDNLLDRGYAEHLSRAGAMVAGYAQALQVAEPGRTLWLRAEFTMD